MTTDVVAQSRGPADTNIYDSPRGWRALSSVSHKTVGQRFVVTGLVFFVLGGIEALLMRVQLMQPEFDFLNAEQYNQIFTLHGSTMMFLFAVPVIEGMANYLIPLLIGARDLPFPRFNAFNYWMYLFAGLLLYSSILFDAVPDAGWFAYTPLSGPVYSSGIRDGLLAGRCHARGDLCDRGVDRVHRLDPQDQGPGHVAEPDADPGLVDAGHLGDARRRLHAPGRRQPAPGVATGCWAPRSSTRRWAAATCCGSTSSGSSAIPRST